MSADEWLAITMELVRVIVRPVVIEEVARSGVPTRIEYLTVDEAAEAARVAPNTVRRWQRNGRLDKHWAGSAVRVRRDDLDRFLRGQRRADGKSPEDLADEELRHRYGC
jgi:excisionase family DNA binding protein